MQEWELNWDGDRPWELSHKQGFSEEDSNKWEPFFDSSLFSKSLFYRFLCPFLQLNLQARPLVGQKIQATNVEYQQK